jgi:hypothetical protein
MNGTIRCNGVQGLRAFVSFAALHYHTGADMSFNFEEFWLSSEAAWKSYTFHYFLCDSVCLSHLFVFDLSVAWQERLARDAGW